MGRLPPLARGVLAGSALAAFLAVPLVQMALANGEPSRADVVVVLGARTYADGTASHALADRVATGAELVRAGVAPRLLLSGGPGDGPVHETEAMRALAERLGVDASAIVLDRSGTSTHATARATAVWQKSTGAREAIVVTHQYHLPRALLEMRRAGVVAHGVPARETRVLAKMPWFLTREIFGWWATLLIPSSLRDAGKRPDTPSPAQT